MKILVPGEFFASEKLSGRRTLRAKNDPGEEISGQKIIRAKNYPGEEEF
jgi:hypothetical protein